jgi:hypothetical protein
MEGEALREVLIAWKSHPDFFANGSNPLGILAELQQGLSGATILGDGSVALLVDVPAFLRDLRMAA